MTCRAIEKGEVRGEGTIIEVTQSDWRGNLCTSLDLAKSYLVCFSLFPQQLSFAKSHFVMEQPSKCLFSSVAASLILPITSILLC